jgi:mRNA-degrading endonuclease HigB of HigAB toxin-antitoxin module
MWLAMTEASDWEEPGEVRLTFPILDSFDGKQAVFAIQGNSYRLVAEFAYVPVSLAFIHFVGTSAEYEKHDRTRR